MEENLAAKVSVQLGKKHVLRLLPHWKEAPKIRQVRLTTEIMSHQ